MLVSFCTLVKVGCLIGRLGADITQQVSFFELNVGLVHVGYWVCHRLMV